ncbi:MAG: hypothetical protein SGPRY_010819 [Prymnesium sp.]
MGKSKLGLHTTAAQRKAPRRTFEFYRLSNPGTGQTYDATAKLERKVLQPHNQLRPVVTSKSFQRGLLAEGDRMVLTKRDQRSESLRDAFDDGSDDSSDDEPPASADLPPRPKTQPQLEMREEESPRPVSQPHLASPPRAPSQQPPQERSSRGWHAAQPDRSASTQPKSYIAKGPPSQTSKVRSRLATSLQGPSYALPTIITGASSAKAEVLIVDPTELRRMAAAASWNCGEQSEHGSPETEVKTTTFPPLEFIMPDQKALAGAWARSQHMYKTRKLKQRMGRMQLEARLEGIYDIPETGAISEPDFQSEC